MKRRAARVRAPCDSGALGDVSMNVAHHERAPACAVKQIAPAFRLARSRRFVFMRSTCSTLRSIERQIYNS